MKNNKKSNMESISEKLHTDENGDTWTESGLYVINDCEPGGLMDVINRICNGEEPPPLEDKKKSRSPRQ